ncbi:uncharacterized protein LOC118438950 isoform X2 [Folsomia candida]|uniref:F-box/LRR-repeat protein 15 n=1 Tax=Folsomia candida TaxID=158441 RepID=A0A226D9Q7_FOLCA|nr:uncharacterized protein LOC118438950 isoform X2 [Folsomia candida]OXA41883.1 F-box/LRR-repeat protein 15 [Folsomia candida]
MEEVSEVSEIPDEIPDIIKDDEKVLTPYTFPEMVIGNLMCTAIGQNQIGRFSLEKLAPISPNPTSWCTNIPKVLAACQIELQTEPEIESVLITKDALLWTNICLLEESYIAFANFPRFASLLGPQIQILKLDKFFGQIPEISFISCCVSLKSLTIIQMDVTRGPRMLLPSEFPNFSKTFAKVRFLSTENIYFENPRQLEFFKNFLHRFPKLEQVSIPHPHSGGSTSTGGVKMRNPTQWETMKTLQFKYLIKPVIDYLNERHNNMNLPVNPIRRTVNAAGVFSTVFPELANACAKNGAFLTNVRQKQIENLFLAQDSTLGKILYLTDALNDRRLLARWVNLEKICLKTSVCDIRSETREGNKIPTFPILKSIHLIFDSDSMLDPGFQALKRLLRLMICQTRASVKELVVQWSPFGNDTPPDIINPMEIVKHLPNLVKFHASHWEGWDDDLLQLLGGLRKLQHLAIEDCPQFTEHGIMGHDANKPVILQLSDLRHIEIINKTGSSSITDHCFEKAFQHLKLKTFVFDVFPNLVTKTGYKCLTGGEFANFIEVFPQPRHLPVDMHKDEFDQLRKSFRNWTF